MAENIYLSILSNNTSVKEILNDKEQFKKIEFWLITILFVFAGFSLATDSGQYNQELFLRHLTPFDYYDNYFFPNLIEYALVYVTFVFLNFKVFPILVGEENKKQPVLYLVLVFLALGFCLGVLDTYAQNYLFHAFKTEDEALDNFFQKSYLQAGWYIFVFALYYAIKLAVFYLLNNSEAIQSKYRIVTRDGLIGIVIWMVTMFLLIIGRAEGEAIIGWAIVGPISVVLFCYAFYKLIPEALTKKRRFLSYLMVAALFSFLSFFPATIIGIAFSNGGDFGLAVGLVCGFFQFLITFPVAYFLYMRHLKSQEEVHGLKRELGNSTANLDFLRSQINPHFLFNTLNTLYGTALQENSDRTAQGIQMLGDMMRFMLHENHQQKILLAREMEYLNNYIALQSLRTSTSPDITIQTNIEDVLSEKFIAPMLLIPFVENAFKHGISLQNKSWIRVSLHCDQKKLYFDVYNSIHAKSEVDPERDKSGVGLENVRQRLNLLYPKRHELIIRETAKEFFVHLTLDL
ncbi:sensor histidine kinase [Nibribacter ruber]|uniref:Sensor histidine kinase n=1 Tax=Nibribacter ruber TaxID=2698458 RepID=A0A6P1NVK5_9BACT|nr:histidine kinase [Nibribacter ruber]QHL86008.1 sensor histidine kinase [Nibribacter ruber]